MKNLSNKGYVLLETIIVAVFIIGIFTFIYFSIVPLIGKYEDLTHDYDIDAAYKLYHVRDAIYKDDNFSSIVSNKYNEIISSNFRDSSYYDSLSEYLFDDDYQVVYIRDLRSFNSDNAFNNLCTSLGIQNSNFKDYVKKIRDTKADDIMQNFIFLNDSGNFAYLGLALDLKNPTDYKEISVTDTKSHRDTSGANSPKVTNGMIPLYFDSDDNTWHKADATNKSDFYYWYDYNKYMWANIALVKEDKRNYYKSASLGTLVSLDDILAFYVWIPRYEYFIDGNYGLNGISASTPGEISVNFVSKTVDKERVLNGVTWRTATAFTFGDDELDGIWFAKFEMSSSDIKGYTYNGVSVPFILPDVYSWTDKKIASFYSVINNYMNDTNGSTIYGLNSDTYSFDAHLMKNGEWGAVAYLSQSKYGKYGNNSYSGKYKEVYINNRQNSEGTEIKIVTGSSGAGPSKDKSIAVTTSCAQTANNNAGCFRYYVSGSITVNDEVIPGAGVGASTTGTVYGVYDMSGGIKEIIMGAIGANNANCANTKIYSGGYEAFTGFKGPLSMYSGGCNNNPDDLDFPTDSKYFDTYVNSGSLIGCGTSSLRKKVCYSQAMSETAGWYDNDKNNASLLLPWYSRGGQIAASSGVFAITSFGGTNASDIYTTRPTIVMY